MDVLMQKLLRRARGALGIGAVWAFGWSAIGTIPRWVLGINADAPFPLIFGVLGFLAGIIFSSVIVLAEGRRRFEEMSVVRFASWGAVGGLVLAGVFARMASLEWGDVMMVAPTFAIACAICAAGSLALARRARVREAAPS